jgi:hypothetical protein
MQKLRVLPGLHMAADIGAFGRRQPVPNIGAVDRNGAIVQGSGIFGIKVYRPIDAVGCVPLLLFALFVKVQQRHAAFVVIPAECRAAAAIDFHPV